MFGLFFLVAFAAFTTYGDDSCASSVSLDGYKWDVTNWSAGCARSCYYSFKISGPIYEDNIKIPAFTASCSSFRDGEPFYPCQIETPADDPSLGVSARLERGGPSNPGAHIAVSYRFPDSSQSESYRNFTGYATSSFNQFVAPPQNFTIVPTEFVGVA